MYQNWCLCHYSVTKVTTISVLLGKLKALLNDPYKMMTKQYFVMYVLQCHLRNDGAEYCGSIYHKIRRDLEGGVKLAWSSAKSSSLELGTKYKIDGDSSVSVSPSNDRRFYWHWSRFFLCMYMLDWEHSLWQCFPSMLSIGLYWKHVLYSYLNPLKNFRDISEFLLLYDRNID